MIKIEFTPEAMAELQYERRYHPHPRVQQKMETVYLKGLGYSHQAIGRIVGISQKTLRSYLAAYKNGGIAALKQLKFRQPTSELAKHATSIEADFEADPPQTLKEAKQRIEALTGICRSPTQIRTFLKQCGLKRVKVGQVPAKADPAAQQRFLEEKLQPRITEAQQGQRQLFFVDAAHFVLQPFLGFLWCFSRVFLQAPSGRQRFNVLGALNAVTLQVITVTNTDYINAASVALLLHKLRAACPHLPLTLVLDNARYQHCAAVITLAASLEIELLFLPPYSPNLNLIERLWKFVKKQCLYSKYYETFPKFQQAIQGCLAEAQGRHHQALSTLLTLNFQTFPNVTL